MKRFLLFIFFSIPLVAACAQQVPSQPVTPAPITSQEAVPTMAGYPSPTLPAFTPTGTETQIGFNIKGWVCGG